MVRIFNLPLINHEGASVYSIDLHPSGRKLATAGQDQNGAGLLVIWDISFVREYAEKMEECDPDNFGHVAKIIHSSKSTSLSSIVTSI